jgi:hypothetical protein
MADPRILLFSGDPAVAPGSVGTQAMNPNLTVNGGLDVSKWSQGTFYADVVAIAANSIEWQLEVSADDATYVPVQILRPAVVPDADPPAYRVQYTFAAGAGTKPATILPLTATFIRVRATRVGGGGNSFAVRVELGSTQLEGLGT